MNPQLKALAVAEPLFGGAVTAFLLPFRNVNISVRETQLDAIDPHYRYTHRESGEQATVEPLEHALAVEQKRVSVWSVRDNWSTTHDNFTAVDPAIIDLEFAPFDDATPVEVRALALYWQTAPKDVEGRWEAWRTLVSIEASNALVEAYLAARKGRTQAPPKAEGDNADPLASPSDSASSELSSSTPAA